jgi:hypothetical protein
VQLVLAIVPAKARLYPEHLGEGNRPASTPTCTRTSTPGAPGQRIAPTCWACQAKPAASVPAHRHPLDPGRRRNRRQPWPSHCRQVPAQRRTADVRHRGRQKARPQGRPASVPAAGPAVRKPDAGPRACRSATPCRARPKRSR